MKNATLIHAPSASVARSEWRGVKGLLSARDDERWQSPSLYTFAIVFSTDSYLKHLGPFQSGIKAQITNQPFTWLRGVTQQILDLPLL